VGSGFEPGRPTGQRRRRDLARLNLALRGLGEQIGQRPGWRAQHAGETVHTGIDWDACVRALTEVSPRLGSWACAAAAQAHEALAAIRAVDLPVTVVHGDFHEQDVRSVRCSSVSWRMRWCKVAFSAVIRWAEPVLRGISRSRDHSAEFSDPAALGQDLGVRAAERVFGVEFPFPPGRLGFRGGCGWHSK
jgi:hypothetical protein